MQRSELKKSGVVNKTNDDYRNTADGDFLAYAQDMYNYECDVQQDGRALRARDERFYDGHQFTDEERAVYEERGQKPRVYNETKPAIDWIIGSERRARADWSIQPRTEDDVVSAMHKTKLVKYIDDINKAKWQRSKAFEDCVKTGEGWIRISVEPNEDGELMIQLNHENWQNIIIDSQSVQEDLSDCRYLWVSRIVDLETLKVWFPDKKDAIEQDAGEYVELDEDVRMDQLGSDSLASNDHFNRNRWQAYDQSRIQVVRSGSMKITGGWYSSTRQAVRVWEMWYRKTERVELMANAGKLTGQVFDSNNQLHQQALTEGAKKRDKVREQMYMAIYTDTTVLFNDKSIYEHNRFPFVRRLAFVDKTTKTPYGVIRQIVDPQSDLNIRRNQALLMMATKQVVADEGAVEDKDMAAIEVAKPNGWIEVKAGKKFQILDNVNMAGPHVQFAESDSAYVKQISGVTSENRGTNSNALSGVAIQSLQEQGSVITTPIIDNHILAHQLEGEIVLSLCEQFIHRKMQFRITNDAKNPTEKDFLTLNDTPETDITASQADFVVAQKNYEQSMRLSLSEHLLNVAAQITQATGNPMLAIAFVEMAIGLQDIPDKDRLLSSLREAANLPSADENADEKAAREAAMQAEAAAAKAQAEQAQALAFAKQESAINLDNSRANQYNREGEREKANARKVQAEGLIALLEAAGIMMDNEKLVAVVDDLVDHIDNTEGTDILQQPDGNKQPQVPMKTALAGDAQEQQQPPQQQLQMPPKLPQQEVSSEEGEQQAPPMSPEEQAVLEQLMAQDQNNQQGQ